MTKGLESFPFTHVKNEQWILRIHRLARAKRRHLGAFLIPPTISSFGEGDLIAGPTKNEDVLDERLVSESGIDD